MKDKNLTDRTGCEVIAEFMGIDPEFEYDVIHYVSDYYFRGWISESSYEDVKHLNTTSLEDTRTKQIPYDTSWNHLMPVVDHIHALGLSNPDVLMSDCYRELCDISIVANIGVVYIKVLEFITWYNQQKK